MQSAVSVRDLTKCYGPVQVLKGINLELLSGRFYALLGQNGSGKSTLMRVLMRHEANDAGGGSVLGFDLDEDSDSRNLEIGFVSEGLSLPGSSPISRIFRIYSELYPKWDDALFWSTLTEFGIKRHQSFASLSRGQRMQVGMASAIAIKPRLLLLDEITSVLDARARSFYLNYLAEFVKSGGTILLSTNIVSEVHHYATDLIFLEDGKIHLNESVGKVSELFKRLRKPKGEEDPVFDQPDCVPVGINADDSLAYVMPRGKVCPQRFEDQGRVSPEEAFIFFTRKKGG